ncbi:DegT/DnrJ/EryC1/StrS family aminotransferase [Prevotella cerevisiae]|jgi:dTDP-4-amino-4,6-dideoxygalactose transaminase|uniref:DegT/DnrJ/EryC1/StrS family aminotransferase n=1 Tax=Segatella cerevisiae TaxID=2053716 RepID=A0ABT1BWZ8_9BACT|nr:DegT/DnrJ/EryC1/StrS family aminotransferase [Segatella cerevisiae]MCH3994793.1 DegT/DnrJ/EryC1/StrS family aminotransferase [Prevotella sp.]MCO6025611.1 DegT/DnrJ/EryC1/StrS family aminotransferase [Segatella cerevisiae]
MIRLSKSVVGEAESTAVAHVINDIGYLGMGEIVGLFEKDLENYIGGGMKCICVNSGTAALHLAIQAVTKPGDEVLVPSFTFVATYQAITAAGCIPVSCEIDPDSLLLDLKDAERRITPRTKVLLPVYFASNLAHMDDYREFARKHHLRLVEDAAHAFGCRHNGKLVGSSGDIVCFSFDGIKNITSGEGGAIFASDQKVIDAVSDARLLGVMKDSEKRYKGQRSYVFDVVAQGYRYHMSNIFAAIGRVQLTRFEKEFVPKRQHIAQLYTELLGHNEDVKLIPMNYHEIVPHIFPVLILHGKREKLMKQLTEHDIQFGIQYRPNHLLTYFKTDYPLPITEDIYKKIISLPMHPELTDEDVKSICSIVNNL